MLCKTGECAPQDTKQWIKKQKDEKLLGPLDWITLKKKTALGMFEEFALTFSQVLK